MLSTGYDLFAVEQKSPSGKHTEAATFVVLKAWAEFDAPRTADVRCSAPQRVLTAVTTQLSAAVNGSAPSDHVLWYHLLLPALERAGWVSAESNPMATINRLPNQALLWFTAAKSLAEQVRPFAWLSTCSLRF